MLDYVEVSGLNSYQRAILRHSVEDLDSSQHCFLPRYRMVSCPAWHTWKTQPPEKASPETDFPLNMLYSLESTRLGQPKT